MLKNIVNSIKFKMYKSQVKSSLNNAMKNAEEFYVNLTYLKHSKDRITSQDKDKLYKNLSILYRYFSNDSYFSNGKYVSINNIGELYLDDNIDPAFVNSEKRDDEIFDLKSKYKLESKKFIKSYMQLKDTLEQQSAEFESYLLKANKFITEMKVLKYTYVSEERINELKTNGNVRRYLNGGTNKIEEFKEFEKLYDNLDKHISDWRLSVGVRSRINEFSNELKSYNGTYIVKRVIDELKNSYAETFEFVEKLPDFIEMFGDVKRFNSVYGNLDKEINKKNEAYIETELENNKEFFSNIDGKSLDAQQRIAVITDEMSNLIIAGAGAGKTLTIVAKVKYLVEQKRIKSEDILLISFTNKSSNEMQDRIVNRLGINVESMTFHKLGLNIISEEDGVKPNISSLKIDKIVNKYFTEEIINNPRLIKTLVQYFGCYMNIPPDWEKFSNLAEKHEFDKGLDLNTIKGKSMQAKYIKDNIEKLKKDLTTIEGENVKSSEELMIANYLFLNGVTYTYEKPYEFDTRDPKYRQYKPDFYLDDYKIYIEHFGVSENNRAHWLDAVEEEKYLEGMEWKRKKHAEKGTKLIETYSYYNGKGILLSELERKLKEEGVKFRKVDFVEIFNTLYRNKKNDYLIGLSKLFSTFISLAKSNGYKPKGLKKITETEKGNLFLEQRTRLFIDLAIPIFEYYEKYLNDEESIDFNDMINMATNIIDKSEATFDYKYVIIDEYQDTSNSRQKLVMSIKDKTDAKLVCVGDDYQSIYRFAGSDIGMFLNFEDHFGYCEKMKIEKTYRNSQQLVDIAGKFIAKNSNQIPKALTSDKNNPIPIKIIGYSADLVNALIEAIEDIVSRYGDEAEIMLLGRNNFDINTVESNKFFNIKRSRQSNQVSLNYSKYPKLNMFFITVHSAKGLEAENVIIVNGKNDLLGFPNKIADDPILSCLLTEPDPYPYGEERRLFYVALTRTKNDVFILTQDTKMSEFLEELIRDFHIEYKTSLVKNTIRDNPNCPKCKGGKLLLRKSKNREFVGCSNYPQCDFTYYNTDILYKHIECPECGAYLTLKKWKNGEFYGCINYPKCTYKPDYTSLKNNI